MSTEPQRYDPISISGARREDVMEPVRYGDYVIFSDWEALKAERDSLKKDVQDLKNRDEYRENHIADIRSERDELRKEVKQLQDILIKRMP